MAGRVGLGIFLLAWTLSASAVSLGELELRSGLYQRLEARIALSPQPHRPGELTVRLGAPDEYSRRGLYWIAALHGVQVVLQQEGERSYLQFTSSRPLREPTLDLLVQLSWPGGKLWRGYTLLLDPVPPDTGSGAPWPAAASTGTAAAAYIQVEKHETLGAIATRLADRLQVSITRTLVALFHANPHAFFGDNMNNLRAGARLRIPTDDELAQWDQGQARREVARHYAAWKRPPATRPSPAGEGDAGRGSQPESPPEQVVQAAPEQRGPAVRVLVAAPDPDLAIEGTSEALRQGLAEVRDYNATVYDQNRELRERLVKLERSIARTSQQALALSETGSRRAPAAAETADVPNPTSPVPPPRVVATLPGTRADAVDTPDRALGWWDPLVTGTLGLLVAALALFLWRTSRREVGSG